MMEKKKLLGAINCLVLFSACMYSMQLPTEFGMPTVPENGWTDSYDKIVEAGIKAFQSPAVQKKHNELLNHSNESAKVFLSEMKKELSEDQKRIIKNVLSNVHGVLKEGNKLARQIANSDITDEQKKELSEQFMANVMFEIGSLGMFMQLLSGAIEKRIDQVEKDPELKKNLQETVIKLATQRLEEMVRCVEEMKDSMEA